MPLTLSHISEMKFLIVICNVIAFLCFTAPGFAEVRLPAGFTLKKFATVPNARSLAPVPKLGLIFVGTRGDSLYAVTQKGHTILLADDLYVPNGIAWKDGYLYVAEQHRLIRFKIGDALPAKWPKPEILFTDFPNIRLHGWRYAAFGPDGALYVSIGSPCNICEINNFEGTILRFDPTTWVPTVFARGIRNSVGIAFDPRNGDMIFTDNGADNMGDNIPPDEINRAATAGLHFGFPYFGGGSARTTEFKGAPLPENRAPLYGFQAHVAPLGLHFYRADRFPEHYRHGVFVAQHGSWNRTIPVGYQISFLVMDQRGKVVREEPFLTGWLSKNGDVTARPVDIAPWTNGSLLISDDAEDSLYILDYQE